MPKKGFERLILVLHVLNPYPVEIRSGAMVAFCEDAGLELDELDDDQLAGIDERLTPDVRSVLSVAGALSARKARGGTAPERVAEQLRGRGWEVPVTRANFVFLPTGERTTEIALAMEKQGVVTRPFPGLGIRITISTLEENVRWLKALRDATGR